MDNFIHLSKVCVFVRCSNNTLATTIAFASTSQCSLELSTILAMERLHHGNYNAGDDQQKNEGCNTHPFSRALLQTLDPLKGLFPDCSWSTAA